MSLVSVLWKNMCLDVEIDNNYRSIVTVLMTFNNIRRATADMIATELRPS